MLQKWWPFHHGFIWRNYQFIFVLPYIRLQLCFIAESSTEEITWYTKFLKPYLGILPEIWETSWLEQSTSSPFDKLIGQYSPYEPSRDLNSFGVIQSPAMLAAQPENWFKHVYKNLIRACRWNDWCLFDLKDSSCIPILWFHSYIHSLFSKNGYHFILLILSNAFKKMSWKLLADHKIKLYHGIIIT